MRASVRSSAFRRSSPFLMKPPEGGTPNDLKPCRAARPPHSKLSPETFDKALVHSARHTHVVQVVFANLGEPAGLIEIENFAAFDLAGLARFNSQSPGNVVETDAVATAEPPPLHRVEHSTDVVFAQVDRRPGGDVIHQAALIDKRQVKTDNVVADDFIALQIKIRD